MFCFATLLKYIHTYLCLAAEAYGVAMGLSTFSTTSYEVVSDAAPDLNLMMQLYLFKNRELSVSLIRRAEKAGFKAIVLTVDLPCYGQRVADVRHKFKIPEHLSLGNFQGITGVSDVHSYDGSAWMEYTAKNLEHVLNWDTVAWLRSITKLPIILKGILSREDALESIKHDIQGMIVSNHGGRQLDGVPSTVITFLDLFLISTCLLTYNSTKCSS